MRIIDHRMICPQAPILPPRNIPQLKKNLNLFESTRYRNISAEYLGEAVRIQTVSYDDMRPPGNDSRWDVFEELEEFLRRTFNTVHETLKLEHINGHGLMYTWPGSDWSLKPILLMAHQDVVPIAEDTKDQWLHPPFGGHYDGFGVWGRGAGDCKNNLMGIMEAITALIQGGFEPRRTVLLSFGFDEEIGGSYGAAHLAAHIEQVHGKDSIEFILDEGGLGLQEQYGSLFALPALAEKGYVDMKITVETPGGHSSIPPPHTAIGLLSELIRTIEENPPDKELFLDTNSPYYETLRCMARFGYSMESTLRDSILSGEPEKLERVAHGLAGQDRKNRFLMQTSQAIDILQGGNKVNALPERAETIVNYRIAVHSRVSDIQDHLIEFLTPKAKSLDLEFYAFGEKIGKRRFGRIGPRAGKVTLEALNPLEPAPISSTGSRTWAVLQGTIKHVWRHPGPDGESITVAPSLMTGNTDTLHYWNVSKNIYRFTPSRVSGRKGIHTVNERMSMDDHIDGVKFYHELIRNADEASL
ncbi:Gly-Xaa carboxypeptidase [Saitoella coloradoensis]